MFKREELIPYTHSSIDVLFFGEFRQEGTNRAAECPHDLISGVSVFTYTSCLIKGEHCARLCIHLFVASWTNRNTQCSHASRRQEPFGNSAVFAPVYELCLFFDNVTRVSRDCFIPIFFTLLHVFVNWKYWKLYGNHSDFFCALNYKFCWNYSIIYTIRLNIIIEIFTFYCYSN